MRYCLRMNDEGYLPEVIDGKVPKPATLRERAYNFTLHDAQARLDMTLSYSVLYSTLADTQS